MLYVSHIVLHISKKEKRSARRLKNMLHVKYALLSVAILDPRAFGLTAHVAKLFTKGRVMGSRMLCSLFEILLRMLQEISPMYN